jgi:hypothetical protein
VQVITGCPDQVTVFDDLGIYQLLSEIVNIGSVEAFVHRWLGNLLDYDATRCAARRNPVLLSGVRRQLRPDRSDVVTASQYIALPVTTIREVSAHDLNDPDIRFNLQLATRAWKTVHAMHQRPSHQRP